MKYTTLIVNVAAALMFDAHDRAHRLGWRLSPVDLSPDEALELGVEADERLPAGAFIAISTPGAARREGPRLLVCGDDEAATRATSWRNKVGPDQAVLYVSAQRHGRAGGLRDAFEVLDERKLRAGVLDEAARRLPDDVLRGLRAAEVLEKVPVRDVCAFITAADGDLARVGDALPLLSLIRDTHLSEAPAARLEENARWVRAALSGSVRKTTALSAEGERVRAAVREAIDGAPDERLGRLRELDLGSLPLDELRLDSQRGKKRPAAPKGRLTLAAPSAPTKRAPPPKPTPKPKLRRASEPREATARPAPSPQPSVTATPEVSRTPELAPPRPPTLALEPQPAHRPASAEPAEAPSSAPAAAPPRAAPRPPASAPRPRPVVPGPWTHALDAEAGVGAPLLPSGATTLLRTSIEHDGDPLAWHLASGVASALERLPKGVAPVAHGDAALTQLPTLTAWRGARAELIAALGADATTQLLSAPYVALSAKAPLTAARELLAAAAALRDEAASADLLHAVMQLDTVTVTAASGEAVAMLTPLHMILLGQLVQRVDQLASAAKREPAGRVLAAVAADAPPAVPATWRTSDGATLRWRLSPRWTPLYGAPLTDVGTVANATHAAGRALLTLRPHARVALCVVAEDDEQEVADGLAALFEEDLGLQGVRLHSRRSVDAGELAATGKLVVEGVDGSARPHLVVRRAAASDQRAAALPGTWPAVQWRPAAAGPAPLGALSSDAGVWTLVIGELLTGPPPPGATVLARGLSQREEAVIVAHDSRPLIAAARQALMSGPMTDTRPRAVERAVRSLASVNAGMLDLGDAVRAELAATLAVAGAAQALSDEAITAHLSARARAALFGPSSVGVAIAGEALRDSVALAVCVASTRREDTLSARAAVARATELFADGAHRAALTQVLARAFDDVGGEGVFVADALRSGRPMTARFVSVSDEPTASAPGASTLTRLGATELLAELVS